MSKGIHKVQVGDLVRGDPLKIHELTLKLWEVTEPTGHTHYAPANLYEVV